MELINLNSLNLTTEEFGDIIKFLAQKRGITTKKLLSTIKLNLKRKNNKDLTSKSQQKLVKTQQKLVKTQLALIKSQRELTKSQRELRKTQRGLIKPTKPLQTLCNTKEIRNHFYNIENKNELENKNEYLNELDKKIINNNNDDFIENVRDLFNIVNYEPVLIKTGFNNNYLEYRSEGNDSLSFEEYLNLIKPYLNDLINDKKDKGEWKLQLTAQINFISQKPGSDETRVMHTRSVCEEFISGSETEEIVEKLFRSLLQRYQDNLNEKMRGSDFIFNEINYLFYDFNRVSISKGGYYIESPKWFKDKKCTVNQKNNDNKCFQYATTLALNFNKINKRPQRISRIKSFIENYNWNDINFPTTKKDWNRFELNNKDVALNILYVPFNTKKIEIAYKFKYNLVRDNQIILLMISNGENWHYLAVKSLSRLLRRITSNHDADYYCLNCFHSYRTENKLNAH